MAALTLQPPGPDFHALPLGPLITVNPVSLHRISNFDTGEPYFGRSGASRFDDPARAKSRRFGTCYLGLSFKVAFAESVLHDMVPENGHFVVPESEITRRFAIAFEGDDLQLANLTGTNLLVLGGNGELTGTSHYSLSKKWAAAVAAHPANADGFIYMSRRVNDSVAVVLFERDKHAPLPMRMRSAMPLHQHPDFLATMQALRVQPEA